MRYIITLIITIALFGTAFFLSNQMAKRKIDEVRMIQDKISTDILSTETRFSLLGSSSCTHINLSQEFENDLSGELSEMARRVKFMENQLGYDDARVSLIRDQYALLQIKDYMLKKQLQERCGENIETILYFFGQDCSKCKEQSIVLDEIGARYPEIRIYWFDIDSTTPAMKTLLSIFNVKDVPALVIKDKYYEDIQSLEEIELYFADFIKKLEREKKEIEAAAAKASTKSTTPQKDIQTKE